MGVVNSFCFLGNLPVRSFSLRRIVKLDTLGTGTFKKAKNMCGCSWSSSTAPPLSQFPTDHYYFLLTKSTIFLEGKYSLTLLTKPGGRKMDEKNSWPSLLSSDRGFGPNQQWSPTSDGSKDWWRLHRGQKSFKFVGMHPKNNQVHGRCVGSSTSFFAKRPDNFYTPQPKTNAACFFFFCEEITGKIEELVTASAGCDIFESKVIYCTWLVLQSLFQICQGTQCWRFLGLRASPPSNPNMVWNQTWRESCWNKVNNTLGYSPSMMQVTTIFWYIVDPDQNLHLPRASILGLGNHPNNFYNEGTLKKNMKQVTYKKQHLSKTWLVGGFNPFEKYQSKWESSPK